MSNWFRNNEKGVTLTELLITSVLVGLLFGYITINFLRTQQKASSRTSINTVVADIKEQQIKAMVGDTEGRSTIDYYGVYFQPTQYTLFHGASYNAGDSANFVIKLGNTTQFSSITFPSSSVVFSKGSGEIVGFINGSNTVTLKNLQSNDTKTITINRYGVITQVN